MGFWPQKWALGGQIGLSNCSSASQSEAGHLPGCLGAGASSRSRSLSPKLTNGASNGSRDARPEAAEGPEHPTVLGSVDQDTMPSNLLHTCSEPGHLYGLIPHPSGTSKLRKIEKSDLTAIYASSTYSIYYVLDAPCRRTCVQNGENRCPMTA